MNQNKIGRSQTNRKYFIDSNCATQDNVKYNISLEEGEGNTILFQMPEVILLMSLV